VTKQPTPGSNALDDAERCLAVLAQVEGHSGRQQVATALHLIYSSRLDEAETLLRGLIDVDLPTQTRQNVFRNLTMTQLRQERWKEALETAELSLDEWPGDPVQVMNICYAAARTGDVALFEENVRHLTSIALRTPSLSVESWISGELPGLARDLKLSPDRLRTMFAPLADDDYAGMQMT
jgi:predicted Zn-dependent protease